MTPDTTAVNIGLSDNARTSVAEALSGVLADTFSLYTKTHGFHWNVTGPQFQTLHALFQEQYNELWSAVDEIAERIRALGSYAPGDPNSLIERSKIGNAPQTPPSAEEMTKILLADHETIAQRLRQAIETADDADDDVSEDLLIRRLEVHDKTAWMLRAMTA
ncbi:MAG: DNA starvation/stationary phase protection protein [Pseudomonadota bacterium]